MIGIIVIIAISWFVLWVASKQHITVLGIRPGGKSLKEFLLGFGVTAVICTVHFLWQATFKEIQYQTHPEFGFISLINGVWWTLKSVLFEELLFRGAVLYLLVHRFGILKACILDAVTFGIYHWFSYGMLGAGVIPLVYVLLVTGASGWMFAYAFAKTKSLYAPIGLHLGWNVVSIVVFSEGPIGNQWLIASNNPVELSEWAVLLFFLWQVLAAPGLVTWYLAKK